MRRTFIALLGSMTLLAAACSAKAANPANPTSPAVTRAGAPSGATQRSHIMFIVLENTEYEEVTPTSMPFLYSQAQKYVLLTNEYAIRHPSLPNYIAMMAGSTYGIHNNCEKGKPGWPCNLRGNSLVDQLAGKGIGWKAYMENLPRRCSNVETAPGGYAKKHNPFMFFDRIRNKPARCKRVVPLGQLSADLKARNLPAFSFLTPNLCHDAHDCSLGVADRFLRTWVPRVLSKMGRTGVIFITWDEGSSDKGCCDGQAAGGRVFTAIVGPGAKLHLKITKTLNHYSLLRAVEDNWGLARLNLAAKAPILRGWQR